MALLTTITPVYNGAIFLPVAAAAGGDTFLNDGSTLVYIKNSSGVSVTVTVDAAGTMGGLSFIDPPVVVTAGQEKILGPFDPSIFNSAANLVALAYTAVTTVTVAVLKAR